MNYSAQYRRDLTTRSAVDTSGALSIFGTMGRGRSIVQTNADFIPVDGKSGIINYSPAGNNPQWLGLTTPLMQSQAYLYCSPLAAVIDRLAEADTNGRVEIYNINTDISPDSYTGSSNAQRIIRLINNPNPFQTWHEFNSEQVVLAKQHGYCCVFALGPAGMDKSHTKALFNIPAYFCKPERDEDLDLYGDNESAIDVWEVTLFGKKYSIPGKDILLVKDGFINSLRGDKLGIPLSKIEGLDFSVSNICAAMEADNVLLKKKGPLGVFSHDPKPDSVAGMTAMRKETKDSLQEDLSRYGMTLGQLQYIISRNPLKWNAMSFNVQELMTKETIRQGIESICDRFGYPAELMSGKNATYENRSSAEKFLYQNNIIPFSLRRMARYNKFFNLDGFLLLRMNFSHLPVLQEDIEKKARAEKASAEASLLDWQNGLITFNEYRVSRGYDKILGMDIYFVEWQKKHGHEEPKQDTVKIAA